MTVIADKVTDVAYAKASRSFTIASYERVRNNGSNDGIVINAEYVVSINPSDGSFTTPDLDPGSAWVDFGANRKYYIEIPESGTPIRLWPLIQAGLPVPPNNPFGQFVANGGNANRAEVLSESVYSALIASQTPDPGSIFFTY